MRGFVLHPTYRVVGGRPEVHLYGTLEAGQSFCVIDDRLRPYFFVPAEAAALAASLGARVEPTALRSLEEVAVVRVEVDVPGQVPHLRAELWARGVPAFEADLRFAYRYLIDNDLRAGLEIDGPWAPGRGIGRVYRNPALSPCEWEPRLRVCAIDIETNPTASEVYAIALCGEKTETVLIRSRAPVRGAESLPGERALLERFFALVRELDPDVLTGWNVIDFDLAVLARRARRHAVPFRLGRTEDETTIQRDPGFTREGRAVATGRQILDGLALLRGAFVHLDDYSLETAARTLLGKGKLLAPGNRAAEIESLFRTDPERLAEYNRNDARLVLEILEATRLIPLVIRRSLLTGMQLDRVGASIASFDALYLGRLRSHGYVAPSVGADVKKEEAAVAGGALLEPHPGLFRNILVFDFQSMYPSVIRTFNIDPLSYVRDSAPPPGAIRAPNGAWFRRSPGILPGVVAELSERRTAARRAGRDLEAHAIKILMNSLYGVLATPACRFFAPPIANAITHFGQLCLRRAAAEVGKRGFRVLYGDTDSLFVDPGRDDAEQALAVAATLRDEIGAALAAWVREEFGCESHLALEFEKVYHRFFLPAVRAGTGGSRKRYAGLLAEGGKEFIEFVGLESVRRDWTELAKRFQREILDRVFHDQPVVDFVREFVASLRRGDYDHLLVYRKAIRKPLEAYTKTTPPHVKAARRRGRLQGRIIAYVHTLAGPEPADAPTSPLDYDHYIERQLRPVADAVLHFLDLRFDDLVRRPGQLSLL